MGKFRSLLAAIAVGATAFGVAASSASADTYQDVLNGAREEGKLFVVVSSPGKPETHAALAKAFNARFGLDISVEWTATSPVQTGTKLIAEQAGTGSVDIIGAGGNQEMKVLFDRGLLKPYPWAEVFGGELKNIGDVANLTIEDLRGTGLLIAHNAYGLGWNPNMIKEEDLPDTYADLLKPEWKGRFAVNAYSLNPTDYYSFAIGKDATMQMAKDILANEPILERGTGAVTRAISVGQAPIGISSFHQAGRVENVKFKFFKDYIPMGVLHIYVPENAPHPNAARLFAAWLATEGMAVVNEHEVLPRRGEGSDLDAKINEVEAGGGKIIGETSLEDTASALSVRKAIGELMTQ